LTTGERIIPEDIKSQEEYVNYLLHLFSYIHVISIISPESIILDSGCGDGYGAFLLSNHVKKVIGIDVDSEIISRARQNYSGNIRFDLYEGVRLPYEKSVFDTITSFQVIEHVEDVDQYLIEIKRVLKPGGQLFITTPNRIHRLKPGQEPWNIYHKREYDHKTLVKTLEKVFEQVQIRGIKGTKEIQQIEIKRVRKNKLLASLDILKLRTKTPENLKRKIVMVLRKIKSTSENMIDDYTKFTINDIYLTEKKLEDSLHFFCICINQR